MLRAGSMAEEERVSSVLVPGSAEKATSLKS